MTSRSAAKGRDWETAICRWLHARGAPHAERRRLSGANDRGDIAGIIGVVVEAKAARTLRLADWLAELDHEIANDGAATGAVWIKRHGKTSPGDGFIVMRPSAWLDLLTQAGHLPPPRDGEPR